MKIEGHFLTVYHGVSIQL